MSVSQRPTRQTPVHIAAVSFLNTLPLLDGLTDTDWVRLAYDVPSRLGRRLATGEADVALLPAIDLQRLDPTPVVLSAGCIASDGPALTVRVFSRVPPEAITRLYVDSHSHCAAALAGVLWAECFSRRLDQVRFDVSMGLPITRAPGRARMVASPASQGGGVAHPSDGGTPTDTHVEATGPCRHSQLDGAHRDADEKAGPEALLLIGDKVVTDPPEGYGWEIDLGAAWRELTDLPAVFAVWAMHPKGSLWGNKRRVAEVARTLADARRRGTARAQEIATVGARAFGWPEDLARKYLTQHLQYKLTDRHRQGIEVLHALAAKHELIPRVRPLTFCPAE